MATREFADYWAQWLGNRFRVTSGRAGIPQEASFGFHKLLREAMEADGSFADLVTNLITAEGATADNPLAAFLSSIPGLTVPSPVFLPDVLDEASIKIVGTFLGIPIHCISCHDGAYHLEKINVYLAGKTRQQFWRQAAFLSGLRFSRANPQAPTVVSDAASAGYVASVPDGDPGARPLRDGQTHLPSYLFGESALTSAPFRQQLAVRLTTDPQFARATVNYLWAHFFRIGIVDPPDAWDLSRIDPANLPPDWPLQPSHPELQDALADAFVSSGFRLRVIIRLMAQSTTYQLSSRYQGRLWKDIYTRLFNRHIPRQLSAEELFDALRDATGTVTAVDLPGLGTTVRSAQELPDPTFPRTLPDLRRFLTLLGRGDRLEEPRDSRSSPIRLLYWMNDPMVVNRTLGAEHRQPTYVNKLAGRGLTDREALRELYLTTLGRYPTLSDEKTALAERNGRDPQERWLSDVQWALLNSVDFVFNH